MAKSRVRKERTGRGKGSSLFLWKEPPYDNVEHANGGNASSADYNRPDGTAENAKYEKDGGESEKCISKSFSHFAATLSVKYLFGY